MLQKQNLTLCGDKRRFRLSLLSLILFIYLLEHSLANRKDSFTPYQFQIAKEDIKQYVASLAAGQYVVGSYRSYQNTVHFF